MCIFKVIFVNADIFTVGTCNLYFFHVDVKIRVNALGGFLL